MERDLLIEVQIAEEKQNGHICADHQHRLLAINDAMHVLSGKWKIQLIGILLFKGRMRFGELLRHLDGIGAKMLSKELQNLEENKLVTRTVLNTKPITVEYEITSYGRSLENTILTIVDWGLNHRKEIMKET
jgi:DNA-binding HxlR family transcriptional regulator